MKKLLFSLLLSFVAVSSTFAAVGKQVPVRKVAKAMLAAPTQNGASWSESFEDCDESDMFWLPEGWTAKRTPEYVNPEEPHTWAVIRQMSLFYPEPVDGTHYATCYYNDDAYQDEWLYTPELTPKQGEYFTYFVTLQPYFLFDTEKYDTETGVMSEYVSTADLRLHVSVDGGEWQMVNSLYDLYKDEDIQKIYEEAFYGYVSNRKMFVDMAEYVGHSVRFGFQYVGQGGSSMYLDDLRLAPLTLTAGYKAPAQAMYFGMTPDFKQPSSYLFLPQQTDLVWTNTSSLEAVSFDWTYSGTTNYNEKLHSTNPSLTTNYASYVPRAEQVTGSENTVDVPLLAVVGVDGQTATYAHPAQKMVIGGKAEVFDGTETMHTGATYCDPAKGYNILTNADGVPYFGVGEGNKELWTRLFGTEAWVTGMGVMVSEPQTPWTMRGLHIQGIGNITKAKKLSVAVRKFNVYGSVDEEPIATAVIDLDNIVEEPYEEGENGVNIYTLPFLFPDPVTIDSDVIITLEGLTKAASWFAPLQTAEFETTDVEASHAIFVYSYNDNYGVQTGMNYVSNLSLMSESGDVVPCATNFFFNFDIAYGDCDDWGHIDIEPAGLEMPELTIAPNTIQVVDAEELVTAFADESESKPMNCAFYDEADEDNLTLYLCVGKLFDYDGQEFYSDVLYNTYNVKLTLPKSAVDAGEQVIDGTTIAAQYYDIIYKDRLVVATSGTVKVDKVGDHLYSVDIRMLDNSTGIAVGANYSHTETWLMRDYNVERPNPSQFELKKSGRVVTHHDILSCVVDQSNEDVPVFYLVDQENVKSVAEVQALPNDIYVRISMPAELMDGMMKGFSGWSNDDMTVTYKGIDYNHSGCQHDDTCYGGNVQVVEYDTDNNKVEINATIFTMILEDRCNMNLHYAGPFVVNDVSTCIKNVDADVDARLYNLQGQRIARPVKGIVISNGRKVLVR